MHQPVGEETAGYGLGNCSSGKTDFINGPQMMLVAAYHTFTGNKIPA
jgi:hypothetical protein